MNTIFELAAQNQRRSFEVIEECGIKSAWESIGAEVHLVGSLKTKLLMTHLDVDFHVYTPELDVVQSFAAMSQIASRPGIVRVQYANLSETSEQCLEWHAWYQDKSQEWQIDMIQILKGSTYDGYFEAVADRISDVLTPQTRQTILELKFQTPETEKIMGIEYYRAVLEGKVSTWSEFLEWRKLHPVSGIVDWRP